MSQVSLLGEGVPHDPTVSINRICENPHKRWEQWWVWGSEQINPIVVKEVRQSLKSKQFTISFGLTLIAAVSWTLLAISLLVPRIYYVPGGATLLAGFFCILALPLMVIIPFSAFRSMTSETEDSTFELLSISALSASQIVYGKMASASLQLLLYLSALAPCIVLTYVLRGVSLFTILFLLGATVLFSVCETALAILAASISRTRMMQTGVSVLLLGGLLWAFFAWTGVIISQGIDEFSNPPREMLVFLFALLTIVAVAISVVLCAASAAIDFPSENHSTRIRWQLMGLLTLTFFWSTMGLVVAEQREVAVAILIGNFGFAMFLGALITGERGVISLRAQRSLPKTFFGRVFLTWMYPGAGLGYVFLICFYAAIVFVMAMFELFYANRLQSFFGNASITATGFTLLCYLTIYVGLNRLMMLGLGRHFAARMVGSVALLIVMLLLIHLIPWVLVYYYNDYREFPYGWHQAFNIWLTVTEVNQQLSLDIGASILIVTLCAIGIFGLNLLLSSRDVMLVRVALPPRVREEAQVAESQREQPPDPFAD